MTSFTEITERDLDERENNILAGNKVVSTFTDISLPVRWTVLCAQMQSGKTFTYAFVAAEMLRRGCVDKIVIFCGSAEVALQEQTMKTVFNADFKELYELYLESIREHYRKIHRIQDRVDYVFGSKLTKKPVQNIARTLFIWDESHYAQNIGMRVDKYLEQIGVLPNGDFHSLNERDNYVLSVSATPFSEISDIVHCGQDKKIVKFIPSDAYLGVKKMLRKSMIIPFSNAEICFREEVALTHERFGTDTKYAIVRIPGESKKDESTLKTRLIQIAQENGWDVLHYYRTEFKLESLNILETAPAKNTLILVKELCRMGQVLKKNHISFVMETAMGSKTDVVLQGLLGRMCGYDSNEFIRICLRKEIVDSRELETYVSMFEEEQEVQVIPSKARNLRLEVILEWAKAIRDIRISRQDRTIDGSPDLEINSETISPKNFLLIAAAIESAILDGRMRNTNDEETTEKVKIIVRSKLDLEKYSQKEIRKYWRFRELKRRINCKDKTEIKYHDRPRQIYETFRTGIPCFGTSGANSRITKENDKDDENKISVWYATESFPEYGISEGDWFINTNILLTPEELEKQRCRWFVPPTNKKETFSRDTECGEKIQSNGHMPIDIHPDSATNTRVMCDAILSSINLSTNQPDGLIVKPYLISNRISEKSYQGIYVTREVYDALKKGGIIYNEILDKTGLRLKAPQKEILDDPLQLRYIRLSKISW
jgi:hypothetical protein